MKLTAPLTVAVALTTGCSTPAGTTATVVDTPVRPVMTGATVDATTGATTGMTTGATANALPAAVIYKMNGDYTSLVPVTLSADRKTLVSFPAPSDLKGAEPVALADGFYLDRRGVNAATAFTRWTYAEYSALPSAPSAAEILGNIDPQARITAIYQLPFAVGTPDLTAKADSLIHAGLKGCKPVYSTPVLEL